MDALSGSLDTFPLEAVLRLIGSAGKPGVLKLDNDRLSGRIFVSDGGVVHATTREVNGTRKAPGAERRARTFSTDPTLTGGDARLEQIVEVLVRLLRDRQGDFVFLPGVTPSAGDVEDASSYDVETLLTESASHIADWERIEPLVPDARSRFVIAPELPTEKFEVTLDGRRWLFLAAVGQGSSVEDLAETLGIFEYPAAMQVAEMIREGLLAGEGDEPAAETAEPVAELIVTTTFEPSADEEPPAVTRSDTTEH